MNNQEFLEYKHYAATNHLFHSSLGATFNPGFLMVFQKETGNTFLDSIMGRHEIAHATLSFSFYGRFIFFLKFLLTDFIAYSISREKNTHEFYQTVDRVKHLLQRLIQGWVITQEGFATYTDYLYLQKRKESAADRFIEKLEQFLKTESPYSKGFHLMQGLGQHYPDYVNPIIHEVGNIDFFQPFEDEV